MKVPQIDEEQQNVTSQLQSTRKESRIAAFFRESAGKWHSQRRYYTLPDGGTKEITSLLAVRFLEPGWEELRELEKLHGLSVSLCCGAYVSWKSTDSVTGRKQSENSTIFGAWGNTLYRDHGFAISQPITAQFYLPTPKTLRLRTEYNSSVFEEEIKLIGDRYRTRQTIISRAGEQQMIGQYLEKRIDQ